jgi:hypothetical protein
MPARCATASASAIWIAMGRNSSGRHRALLEARRQRVALEQFHYKVVRCILLADVVEDADVRMIESRHGARFALEALADLGLLREVRRDYLDRDQAVEDAYRARGRLRPFHRRRARPGFRTDRDGFRSTGAWCGFCNIGFASHKLNRKANCCHAEH